MSSSTVNTTLMQHHQRKLNNSSEKSSSLSAAGSYSSMASGTPLLDPENYNGDDNGGGKRSTKTTSTATADPDQTFIQNLPHEQLFLGFPNHTILRSSTTAAHPLMTQEPRGNEGDVDDDDAVSVASSASVDDDEEVEERILKVVDQVEDEWDDMAYDQLVPLEIKLALEQNLFGWSHLTSDILGHVVFTVGAFFIIYTIASLHIFQTTHTAWIHQLRLLLSVIAACATFRMVRRRRRIWLRASYGSARYMQREEARRKEIAQVDQLSWLARVRVNSKHKKVQKKLAKADSKFRMHHSDTIKRRNSAASSLSPVRDGKNGSYDNGSPLLTINNTPLKQVTPLQRRRRLSFQTEPVPDMQSVQSDQILFANGRIHRVPYAHGGGFGSAPFMLANPHWISVLRHLMPDVYVEISRRVQASPPHRLIHWAENNPVVAAYNTAHELESNGTLPNMEWDVFLDPRLVQRVQVVLRERRAFLLSVLPELPTVKPMETLPDFANQLTESQRNVVKFYERCLRKRVQTLVDEMMIAHGNLAQLSLEQTGLFKSYNYSRVKRTRRTLGGGIYARQWMAVYAESLRVGVLQQTDEPSYLSPASPSPSCSNSSPPPACETPPPPSSSGTAATLTMTPQRITATTSLVDMTTSACPNTSIAASVAIIRHIVKREDPFGLFLDVKSRHVPPQVWACVVDILRESGVRVEGVGAFVHEEIRTLSLHTVRPIREVLLFHSAGDLQQACHDKRIRFGDTVFFNAGSLIWTPASDPEQAGFTGTWQRLFGTFDAEATKQSYRIQPFALPSRADERSYNTMHGWTGSTIEDYKQRYHLSIGLYVQEFAIDEAAANILVRLVNDNPQIYDLGLSWGGVNGITLRGIRPGRFTDTSGFWNQRHLGALWDSSRRPPV